MSSIYFTFKKVFLVLVLFSVLMLPASGQNTGEETGPENIFKGEYATADLDEFRAFALQMARLNPYGQVDLKINHLAEKADFIIPEGGSPWHEYATFTGSVHLFFPDDKVAPYIPADFVIKNRNLLLAKADIIRELNLGAFWRSTEPLFLPEPFFERYPHLRGPRVDHPRRSLHQEFSACFHQAETVEMYQNMVNQLVKNVPEINSFDFNINDAGSGLCWTDLLYSGPNGPAGEKGVPVSESAVTLLNIYINAARKIAGHDVEIFYGNMLTDREKDELVKNQPENCYLRGRNAPPAKNIYNMMYTAWPVRGFMNPLRIMKELSRDINPEPVRFSFQFGDGYRRGNERIETIEKTIDIVEDYLANYVNESLSDSLMPRQLLKKWCKKWGGDQSGQLFDAFVNLESAFMKRKRDYPGFANNLYYYAVSTRHITRPLVFDSERLTPEEENYFLPYVFNVSAEDARNEYLDLHGGDRFLPEGVADGFLEDLKAVYTSIEKIQNAPEQKFLDDLSRSIHMYHCVVRSYRNFNDAQIIRNRHKEKLAAGPVHRPPKAKSFGDNDLLEFNEIMRDEYDNTEELIDLLVNGGMDFISYAKPPFKEDSFLLGADIIEQLKKKRRIMMVHWRDIEGYLTTPYI